MPRANTGFMGAIPSGSYCPILRFGFVLYHIEKCTTNVDSSISSEGKQLRELEASERECDASSGRRLPAAEDTRVVIPCCNPVLPCGPCKRATLRLSHFLDSKGHPVFVSRFEPLPLDHSFASPPPSLLRPLLHHLISQRLPDPRLGKVRGVYCGVLF